MTSTVSTISPFFLNFFCVSLETPISVSGVAGDKKSHPFEEKKKKG